MRNLVALAGLLGLLVLVGCNTRDADDTAADAPAQPAASPAATPEPVTAGAAGEGYQPLAGSVLALENGEEIAVLSVGDFEQNLRQLGGLVAVEGRVKEAYPERGTLVLVDCANMAGCGDGCCPQAEIPVRLALEEYTGVLPIAEHEVIVIGDLSVNDAGYDLAVREIRRGDEVLLQLLTQQT